ncbi:MAG: LysR family transcriptional regulator [Rhodobacter sp.]|nr:LysR family transcriptional regulator [Rhodobacter sp.]
MGFDNWDEIRTAFHVARLGTVSGAAEALGVHHATVIRHIDALEKRLGTKLFQRHARGYTPTEAGRDLQAVALATEDRFSQLAGRIRGQVDTVTGELLVTSIVGVAPLVAPVFVSFQAAHPGVRVRFMADTRLFRLDYGEAHVALRAGDSPQEPDNVVQPLAMLRAGLYGARAYVRAHGTPTGEADLARHRFVTTSGDALRAPFHRWLRERVSDEAFCFVASDSSTMAAAIRAGAGIGFLTVHEAQNDPDLIEIMPSQPEWEVPLWLVTHVDLHRTPKVQAFVAHIKHAAKGWDAP